MTTTQQSGKRIAVIGSGISGLAAAWLLSRRHIVWLFERDSRIGGHTHTHAVETSQGTQNIDTGFIVHNDRTYPNFVRLMQQLGVERQASDMSFGVSGFAAGRSGRVEYSSRGLRGFFAQRSNLLRPIHYKLFAEITRFNRVSTEFITRPQSAAAVELTLGEYLAQHNFGHQMAELYLYPMASAVWSTSLDEIRSFPALTLLRFFHNHGFLTINGHPQWYVLKGGSSSYIAPITEPYRDRIATNARIQCVSQAGGRPTLHFERGHAEQAERFDEVVFACHAAQALALLQSPTGAEQSVLGAFQTTASQTLLHTDDRLLPACNDARAAWNYHLGGDGTETRPAATLTYDMNRLQSLRTPETYCVTLNRTPSIDPAKILRQMEYRHPLYTLAAVRAQARWAEISGQTSGQTSGRADGDRHLHFCGAYWFYGFHEDGLNSAIRVASALGVDW